MTEDHNYNIKEEDQLYLQERGFKIIPRAPAEGDIFPYLVLGYKDPISDAGAEFSFRKSDSEGSRTIENLHPSTHQLMSLINVISRVVLTYKGCPGEPPSGRRIPVFIADSAWWETAEALVQTFPPLVEIAGS